jgi:hypothetical protein
VRDFFRGRWWFILAFVVLVALAILFLRTAADGPYRSCHPYDPERQGCPADTIALVT